MKNRSRSKKPASLSLDQFEALATAIIDDIPERWCTGLNGGFLLLPEVKRDEEFYIMGEYVEDEVMGCSIILYYGSFARLLEDSGYEVWEQELRETVWHELRHHLEAQAGVDDLVREELLEIASLRKSRS